MATQRNSLAETIEKDFLACAICFEQLTDPVGLPCLHAFCFECLDNWHKTSLNKTQIACPVCKETSHVPTEGIRGFPGHFLIKNLTETINMEKKVGKQICCKVCGKVASVHCFNCKNNLCSKCHVHHDAFEFMKDHVVASLDDIESGKEIHEGRFCRLHGEQVRYYCETENEQVCMDCINLKKCQAEHDRTSLKEAATKQRTKIQKITKDCDVANTAAEQSIQSIKKTQQDLKTAKQAALKTLEDVKKDCHRQVDQMVNKHEKEIHQLATEREQNMKKVLASLEKQSQELQTAQANTSKLTESKSDFEISYKYASLSNKIMPLLNSEPEMIEDTLRYMKFETLAPMMVPKGNLSKQEQWNFVREFNTEEHLKELWQIAINKGDIVVQNRDSTTKVFTDNGKMKFTLSESGDSCCVSPDGRYLTVDDINILHFDSMGKLLSTIPHGIANQKGPIMAATDPTGLIILGWQKNTISIHYAEGSLMSHFSTQTTPYNLAATSKQELVVSFDGLLQLMDYFGGNARVIKGPLHVSKWDPGCVCCSPFNEIFVINEGGDGYIYRFDENGKYLGIVTNEVVCARGLAFSLDGNELFVSEEESNLLKVFQRV